MSTAPVHTHYFPSADKVVITPQWKTDVMKSIENMIAQINDPYDGSVQIYLQMTRKVVSLKPYKPVPLKETDG